MTSTFSLKKKNTQSNSIYYVFEVGMADVSATKVLATASTEDIAKAEANKAYLASIRPNFLEATKLRDKNVRDFYDYIQTNKDGGDTDPDDFAKSLDETALDGVEGGDAELKKDTSTDALM